MSLPIEEELPATFPVEAFWAKVDKTDGCWLWTGHLSNGYGLTMHKRKSYRAHRVAWMLLRSAIPAGLVPDHLCRVRRCVRPEHLELVTGRVNTLRGIGPTAQNAKKTHCPQGHPYSGSNLAVAPVADGTQFRFCRACRQIQRDRPVTCHCGATVLERNLRAHQSRAICREAAQRQTPAPDDADGGERR